MRLCWGRWKRPEGAPLRSPHSRIWRRGHIWGGESEEGGRGRGERGALRTSGAVGGGREGRTLEPPRLQSRLHCWGHRVRNYGGGCAGGGVFGTHSCTLGQPRAFLRSSLRPPSPPQRTPRIPIGTQDPPSRSRSSTRGPKQRGPPAPPGPAGTAMLPPAGQGEASHDQRGAATPCRCAHA